MTTWTLTPGWSKPPLSMNDRLHHHVKARIVADIRAAGCWLAREQHIPHLEHVTVSMVWTVPDRKRRDDENPVATLKPFCDGLVDAGIVPDDTPEYMTKLMPTIRYVKGQHGVRFVVESVSVTDSTRPASPLPAQKQTGVPSHQRDVYGDPGAFGGDAA